MIYASEYASTSHWPDGLRGLFIQNLLSLNAWPLQQWSISGWGEAPALFWADASPGFLLLVFKGHSVRAETRGNVADPWKCCQGRTWFAAAWFCVRLSMGSPVNEYAWMTDCSAFSSYPSLYRITSRKPDLIGQAKPSPIIPLQDDETHVRQLLLPSIHLPSSLTSFLTACHFISLWLSLSQQ